MSWLDCRRSVCSLHIGDYIFPFFISWCCSRPTHLSPFLLSPHVKWEGALVLCLISAPLHHSSSALFTTTSLPQRPCLASSFSVSDPSFSLSTPLSLLPHRFLFAPLHPLPSPSLSLFTHPLPLLRSLFLFLTPHNISRSLPLNELIRLISGTLLLKPVPTGPVAELRWWLGSSIFRRQQKVEKHNEEERQLKVIWYFHFEPLYLNVRKGKGRKIKKEDDEWSKHLPRGLDNLRQNSAYAVLLDHFF